MPPATSIDQLIAQIRDEYIQRNELADAYQAEISRASGSTPIGGAEAIGRRKAAIEAAGQARQAAAALIALGAPAAEQIAISVLGFARAKDWHVRSVRDLNLDWMVRMSVALEIGDVLAAIGDERTIPTLIDGLADVDKDVRFTAATVLKGLKDGRAVGPLARALADDSRDVSFAAMGALQAIGGPEAEAALAMHAGKRS